MIRCCVICGASLRGRRSDARHCGAPCRAEASRLRRLLDGKPDGPYRFVHQRLDAMGRRKSRKP
jgi:hypothetical protein